MNDATFLLPVISTAWLMLKVFVELIHHGKAFSKGNFIEGDYHHHQQHMVLLIALFSYCGILLGNIYIADFVFSEEWVPLEILINVTLMYNVEHFAEERMHTKSKTVSLWNAFTIHFKGLITFKKKINL